jgi:hypothetical protein
MGMHRLPTLHLTYLTLPQHHRITTKSSTWTLKQRNNKSVTRTKKPR